MKVILSRKGFDSSFGGCASPIFEDGSVISLPIPEPSARISFSEVGANGRIGAIVEDLTGARKKATDHVHLDPDLDIGSRPRIPGWRPMFGQAEAAQRHLDNQGVGVGDIFLFFGWFRRVERHDGKHRFIRGAVDMHMFFGWLEIGAIWRLPLDAALIPTWASDHAHVNAAYKRNTIYVAAGNGTTYNGGAFRSYSDHLVLTKPGERRSRWRLPRWFYPAVGKSALSYHRNVKRWTLSENCADLQSVGRGQEFVLDADDYPEAGDWVKRLIAGTA